MIGAIERRLKRAEIAHKIKHPKNMGCTTIQRYNFKKISSGPINFAKIFSHIADSFQRQANLLKQLLNDFTSSFSGSSLLAKRLQMLEPLEISCWYVTQHGIAEQ